MIQKVSGRIYDVVHCRIFAGEVVFEDGRIIEINELPGAQVEQQLIMPGFVDAHIHIESSLLSPQAFWSMAINHGTLATVSDPHEVANPLGIEGVSYMINALKGTPFITCWGAPSCVPATNSWIESSGTKFTLAEIHQMLDMPEIGYLSEVMNFPAVLEMQPEIMSFIDLAHRRNKPVDGHAPGLRGADAALYASAGISTDHECTELEEALDKIKAGMKIIIREGSAAKNYEALHYLLRTHPDRTMFGSDDKHAHELRRGHINDMVRRAINEDNHPVFSVLRAASLNPIQHYSLALGLLQVGDKADFIVVNNLSEMKVMESYIAGKKVSEVGICLVPYTRPQTINNFSAHPISVDQLKLAASGKRMRVIQVIDGQLLTRETIRETYIVNGLAQSDPSNNLLKIAVVNRYANSKVAIGFCENFGLMSGAIASSVAHDSHNIVAVGASDKEIAVAINLVIESKGGLAVVSEKENLLLPLPIAGLMSDLPADEVADRYEELHHAVKELGSNLHDALMMLSFMALPVIGELKMTDKGLFSTTQFSHVELFLD